LPEDSFKFSVGPTKAEIKPDGTIIADTPGGKIMLRPDDEKPGKMPWRCRQGHAGTMDVPAIIQTISGKSFSTEQPCPVCGEKILIAEGYYQKGEDGVMVRISGVPS
jgi:hypothetical protein